MTMLCPKIDYNEAPLYYQAEVKKSKILLGKAGIIKEDEEEEVSN